MEKQKPPWIIHVIVPEEECWEHYPELKEHKDYSHSHDLGVFPYFGNIHTHGFDKLGHREMCIPFQIVDQLAMDILNICGFGIMVDHKVFTEGIDHHVLKDFDVKFISFPDDPTLYMLMPDENNKFPGDEGCMEPYCYQETYAKLISDNKDYV